MNNTTLIIISWLSSSIHGKRKTVEDSIPLLIQQHYQGGLRPPSLLCASLADNFPSERLEVLFCVLFYYILLCLFGFE